MITALDNCYPAAEINLKDGKLPPFSTAKDTKRFLRVTVKDFLAQGENAKIFSFHNDEKNQKLKNCEDDLIFEVTPKSNTSEARIQTGNYIGSIVWDGVDVKIESRFGDAFLKRMLNFSNDVFLDDVDASGKKSDDLDFSRFIIFYLFLQSLEKAYVLGLPKSYRNHPHHKMCLKGRLDINNHIKRDIPFAGKISSLSRDLQEIQEIIDVLHKAVTVIKKNAGTDMTKNIAHIKPHLKEAKSNKSVTKKTILAAKTAKALQNPIFAPYKKVLRYAEYIIKMDTLEYSKEGNDDYLGFLVNVAELFEIYVTKLLKRAFPDWTVTSPKINLYEGYFYSRKIIPDIVMQQDNNVLVFDTKYKRMNYKTHTQFDAGDLDRNDFFQINTYMSYYQQHGYKLLCGGLLYPLSTDFRHEQCHANTWLGNPAVNFIVDGISVTDTLNGGVTIDDILCSEDAFLSRIRLVASAVEGSSANATSASG